MSVPSLQTTFYRLTIGIDNPDEKNRRLHVIFKDSSNNKLKEEVLTTTRTVFVLCEKTSCPVKGKTWENKEFLQIIDPDTLIDLGKTLECSVVDADNKLVSDVQCIVIHKEEIDPPKWIPIPNDNIIDINSSNSFHVKIADRRLGEICFYTSAIEIQGVDVRIYGNEINYSDEDKTIDIVPLKEGDKYKYLLSIKGSRLKVSNIRTVDIEEIQITSTRKNHWYNVEFNTSKNIYIKLKAKEINDRKSSDKTDDSKCPWETWFFAIVSLIIWIGLTIIPIRYFNEVCDNYINAIPCDSQIKEISLSQENTNNFSLTINCGSSKTNIVMTLPNLATYKPEKKLSLEKPIGAGGVTFCFVVVCLLYVVFYVFVAFMTLYFIMSLRRYYKLNGNMSSVIEALRNERDREKRKAMQRKILDDMINTYLDKPSSED